MANSRFVLLLVAVCASNTWAQWPTQGGFPGGPGGFPGGPGGFPGGPGGFPGGPGGFPGGPGGFPGGSGLFPGQGFNPLFGGQQGFPQQFQPPQILTCIGTNEAQDHLKITLRPEPNSFTSQNPAFQFGQPRELNRQDWRISAVYIPAASYGAISPSGTSSLVGQFFLALTRYGRTDGNCAGLGGILQNDDLINPSQQQPRGQFSQFGNGMFGQTSYPAGFIQDPIVISQGGNVYSGVVRDLSEADLRGRGIAICLDYLCQRPTTTCCSVVKDSVPATEVVGAPTIGSYSGSQLLTGTGTGTGTGTRATTGTGGSSLFGSPTTGGGGLF